MKAVIAGGTGFIGSALLKSLGGGVVLTRDAGRARRRLPPGTEVHEWNPLAGPAPAEAFRGAEVVFSVLGDPIAKGRWNRRKLAAIRESRVIGSRNLVAGIVAAGGPNILVSASAIGFYGDRGDETLDEGSTNGADTLAGVCREWEAEAFAAREKGIRVHVVRNGIVLRRGGGVLAQMLPPFLMGLGGRLGSGNQWMSWIHLDDLVGMYRMAVERVDAPAILNGVAPHPVTNREFTKALASAVHRPAVFPVPAFAVRLAFGGVAEVMLGSQRVLPKAALGAGFAFRYPDLPGCLAAALERPART